MTWSKLVRLEGPGVSARTQPPPRAGPDASRRSPREVQAPQKLNPPAGSLLQEAVAAVVK